MNETNAIAELLNLNQQNKVICFLFFFVFIAQLSLF